MSSPSKTSLIALPPFSAYSSAFLAAAVGFGSTIALVVQAHVVVGGAAMQIGSAITSLCVGIGVVGAALSCVLRAPIILGWSTPGAALLAAGVSVTSYSVAIGAFAVAGAMTILVGATPVLGRLAARIPVSVASAMLAGVIQERESFFCHFRRHISIYGNGADKEKALTSQGFFFESLKARAGVEPA
ncbi:hypothetical protein EOS_00905 [Caballeronia mineralivorans PML1(12)]|uniref:Benzoate transporter n=1 Tax=Caballeronia mineralivorans PML1(12) TaxID=908627 RepID=A0A0J1D636_9BURK|nr:benzoate/H(+) symporter BenE family transporter [Caballeronia mineralivorans]KLU28117.1 hypothetical protein EOS_00905 [Caballeronia mineralivorans PML1(12)]